MKKLNQKTKHPIGISVTTTADWDKPFLNSSGQIGGWTKNYYDSNTIYFAATWR